MESPENPYFHAFAVLNIPFCIENGTNFDQMEVDFLEQKLTDHQAVLARRVLYGGLMKGIDWKYLEDYELNWVIDNIFSMSGLKKEIIHEVVDAVAECFGVKDAENYSDCNLKNGIFYAGYGCSDTELAIPRYLRYEGDIYEITSIGDYAFSGCTSLVSVIIPDSVIIIGKSAFSGCTSLKSVDIPGSVTDIGLYAFSGCSVLSELSVDSGNRNYLSDDGSLYTFDHKTLIRASAKHRVFSIPDSVIVIGDSAFSGCTSLEYVDIPSSVTDIRDSAFCMCTSLVSIVIPDSVTDIGYSVFNGCTSLESIVIPSSVTDIKASAFFGCSVLSEISVDSGNRNYLSDDGSLYTLDHNTLIRASAKHRVFYIPDSVTKIWVSAFDGCTSLKSVIMPCSVREIWASVFSGCTSLESVTIPSSVKGIGDLVFSGCSVLSEISVDSGNKNYLSDDGSLYTLDHKTLIRASAKHRVFYIPDSVTKISPSAFSGCTSLEFVTIPKSVTEIGSHAFSGCTSLKSVDIPGSVMKIEVNTFCGCTSLESVIIPDSVTNIGDSAFSDCTSLKSVDIPDSVNKIGASAFYGCTSLESVIIPDSVMTIGEYAFFDCISLGQVKIPKNSYIFPNSFDKNLQIVRRQS